MRKTKRGHHRILGAKSGVGASRKTKETTKERKGSFWRLMMTDNRTFVCVRKTVAAAAAAAAHWPTLGPAGNVCQAATRRRRCTFSQEVCVVKQVMPLSRTFCRQIRNISNNLPRLDLRPSTCLSISGVFERNGEGRIKRPSASMMPFRLKFIAQQTAVRPTIVRDLGQMAATFFALKSTLSLC